ncbi:MAG: DHA2 family efflux MFS transporter permease subunit [Chitinophagaceae bacterium]|nr:DHA2 family efflux MFS transporter permease subunit [Chitinophagaceae bacterium]
MLKLGFEKWIVIITVVSASLLQLIDTSIVNVTLTQMMGNLGASLGDISWVVTGYAAANVVMITLSGWLSAKFGRKNYFTASIILFTVASIFCGTSTTISQLILFRIIQGIGGGGLLSTAQAILIETFPKEEIGMANAIFGMGVIIGPSIGPTLGGYITDHLSWHWIFFINIPIGIAATILSILYIKESKHLTKIGKMDWFALALLILFIGALQIILEKGESEDWFDAPYITVLTISSVLAGILFVWRQLTVEHPILNLRLLKNNQFAIGNFFAFIQGIGLYASVFIIPVFCQSMLGFTSQDTGWLLMPGSLAAGAMMPVVAVVMKKTKISPVMLAGIGFALFIFFVWRLSDMSLNTGANDFFWPLILRGVGLGLIFIPLLTITIYPLQSKDVPQGTGMSNMIRQLGGSFGIAMATTYISSRIVFHFNRLSEHISIYNQSTYDRLNSYTGLFVSKGKDLGSSQLSAVASIKGSVYKQAMVLTYNDVFLIVGVFFAVCIPLLLLFRLKGKSVQSVEHKVEMHMAD